MALSIGVVRQGNAWKTCLMEEGQVVEQHAFEDAPQSLSYLEHTCARYPELTLAVSLDCETPFLALSDTSARQWETLLTFANGDWTIEEASQFLVALKRMNLHCYVVPSARYLPGIPLHRKVARHGLGSSNDVCVVAALLSHLREREAVWSEMQLFSIQVNRHSKCIQVVENGSLVNSIAAQIIVNAHDERMREVYEQALWEGLTQDIAGLMAVHHIDDIVVLGEYQNAFIDHFAESYQVYLFPSNEADIAGFESAVGAAALAEGLFLPGKTRDIVERLNIREAFV